jgi:hypothetical protein
VAPVASGSASTGGSPSIGGQSPSPPPEASPTTSGDLALESVAEVVTEDLRVRTRPGVSDPDTMLEPLLQPGTRLYVVDGPVGESGYRWYEILTFDVELTGPGDIVDEEVVTGGWVAVAGKDGEPWVQAATVDCPVTPTDVADLVALDSVTALACFGGMPLTLDARILDCQASPELTSEDWCGADTGSPSFTPGWFDRSFQFLVPGQGSFDHTSMLELHVDPLGTFPDPLPYGVPVSATGMFNHPAASACTEYHYLVNYQPSVHCRTVFAVTNVTPR